MIVNPDFEEPGTIPKPGPAGRIARLLAGLIVLYIFFEAVANFRSFKALTAPRSFFFWLALAVSFFALPDVMNIGFGRRWRRKPQLVVFLLGVLAIVLDVVLYGSVWGPALGLISFLLIAYFTGHLGLSLVIQTVFATPG